MKASKVVVIGEQAYKEIHGHLPRGAGFWMFVGVGDLADQVDFMYNAHPYKEALKKAKQSAAEKDIRIIRVMP
jgi:hypothetical protein